MRLLPRRSRRSPRRGGSAAVRARRALAAALSHYRYGVERWVLLPLAPRLPRPCAYGLAMAVALVDLPSALGAHHRRELDATHGLGGARRWWLTWRRGALPYVDLAFLARLASNLERGKTIGRDMQVEVPADLREHVAAGRPLVAVGGHVAFAPGLAAFAALRELQRSVGVPEAPLPLATAAAEAGGRNPNFARNDLRDRLIRPASRRSRRATATSGRPSSTRDARSRARARCCGPRRGRAASAC